jgi:hypothetical protein
MWNCRAISSSAVVRRYRPHIYSEIAVKRLADQSRCSPTLPISIRRLGCSFRKLVVKTGVLKLQAIFHDGSVGMEFMTDGSSEAEDLRELWLAFDCVAEVLVLDDPAWVRLK